MITHNRLRYAQLALDRLLACEGDFSVWLWDNGSSDGCADLVRSAAHHDRVERVFVSSENVMQTTPFEWMVGECRSPIVGKIDDDCLMPARWIDPLSRALEEREELGVIGCWTFWPEDFDQQVAAPKIRQFGDHRIVTNAYIGGTGLLVRKGLCRRFSNPIPHAMPIHQYRMTSAGYVNGWYYPLIWAEHMDDPRSLHCALKQPGGMNGAFALTAKRRGHKTPEEYERWIREDCRKILSRTREEQMRDWRRKELRSAPRRAVRMSKRFLQRAIQKFMR